MGAAEMTGGMGAAGMMGGMGGMAGPGIAWFLFILLPLAAMLVLAYVGVQALSANDETESHRRDAPRDAADEDPVERLQRRYMEGELSEAEFERALERELADDDGVSDVDRERMSSLDAEPRERSDPADDR